MHVNRLIKAGKINGRPIPLKKLSDKYFGPPSGLIIIVPEAFPPDSKPSIVGPNGQKVPLRFSLSREWTEQQGVFAIGKSYFKSRALAWDRLGPKPLVIQAQSYLGATIVLSKNDQELLTSHYQKGVSLKGALLLIGDDLDKKIVSREDTFFLNQIEKDPGTLKKLSPAPMPSAATPWEY